MRACSRQGPPRQPRTMEINSQQSSSGTSKLAHFAVPATIIRIDVRLTMYTTHFFALCELEDLNKGNAAASRASAIQCRHLLAMVPDSPELGQHVSDKTCFIASVERPKIYYMGSWWVCVVVEKMKLIPAYDVSRLVAAAMRVPSSRQS